jgi:hypothetical protein
VKNAAIVAVSLGFLLSLYASATALWTGRVQIARFSELIAARSETPVQYWFSTSAIVVVTIMCGLALRFVALPVKRKRGHSMSSLPMDWQKK